MMDDRWLSLLSYPVADNSLREWLSAVAVAILVYLLMRIFIRAGVARLAVLARDTTTHWDNAATKALSRTRGLFLLVIVLFPDYNRYMDIQQAVNPEGHEAFEAAGIEFAYPTQTLFLQR